MNVKELKAKKNALGISNKKLAEISGVPIGTVQKVFSGETSSPRYETMLKLEQALVKLDVPTRVIYKTNTERAQGEYGTEFRVHEKAAKYVPNKVQGEYTVDDYMALPDENGERYELIDGVIYDLSAPTKWHQHISGTLYHKLRLYSDKHRGPCYPFISPIDVKLGNDNKTVVQPDVFIHCKHKKAPVFVAEVLSPSTRKRDQGIKMQKYLSSGVKEYWIVDPQKEIVIVYNYTDMDDLKKEAAKNDDAKNNDVKNNAAKNDDADIISIYTFDDKIPVAVWENKCVIDFAEIKADSEMVAELFGDEED